MLMRPSSTNSKKPLISDKTIPSKKPVVVKCFICNQMFHSQDSFDIHMDQHQKKVNKNLPDEIQRKTAESFGLKRKESMSKKNSTLEAINQNQIKDKKFLNKTMNIPLTTIQPMQNPFKSKIGHPHSSMLKKHTPKHQEPNKNQQEKRQISKSPSKNYFAVDKEIAQIDEAIKESTLLMSQMAAITERYEKDDGFFVTTKDAHSDHEDYQQNSDEEVEKNISEHQFISQMKINNWSLSKIEQEILKVNFKTFQSLENCQIQIQFLRKVTKLSSDIKSLEAMNKTKSKILAEVVKIVMTEDSSKTTPKSNSSKFEPKDIKEEENFEARTCSQCLDMISFGEKCIIQGDQFFHKQCFQ